ncbi:MAG: TetR/AcrR family transcriptional regulator [Rhodothermales bacterium]|nr:TetR/AcrR family transcriptional regulator [Rhodothermales bacterium]MBO6779400.1 TetR/AcrR family transcriptional regulator [Rhodothermales bacterium]
MPRSKSFDVDDALDAAVDLFWGKGYAATSMEDLVNHLGINRGSLYATFGSKQALYERAVERYAAGGRDWFSGTINDREVPLREAIKTALVSSAETCNHRGCLLVSTIMERNADDERSRELSSKALDELRAIATAAFESRRGELAFGVTADRAADLMLVTMQGLRVVATTDSQIGADSTIQTVLDTLAPEPPADGNRSREP